MLLFIHVQNLLKTGSCIAGYLRAILYNLD